jgi:Fe-S cluster assembly ATP-binding protein
MLKIKKLNVAAAEEEVLQNINLEVKAGEVHVVLGASGSGKSALMMAISGLPFVDVTSGTIQYKNKKLINQSIDERSRSGICSMFQHPVEISNTTNWDLLEYILKHRKDPRNISDLKEWYIALAKALGLAEHHGILNPDNECMDWAMAMKNDLLMTIMLDPALVLVDDIDEKLKVEDIEIVAGVLKEFFHNSKRGSITFSKNKTMLEAIEPTHVHIMVNGTIALSGGIELLTRIEKDGYPELLTSKEG